MTSQLVGVAEVARLVGVSRQRVNELVRTDDTFPAPLAELAAGRIWALDAIEAWMEARARTGPGAVQVVEVEGITAVAVAGYAFASAICQPIRSREPVLFDLRGCGKLDAKRCEDYACGAAEVMGAGVRRVTPHCLLISPPGIALTGAQQRAIRSYAADRDRGSRRR